MDVSEEEYTVLNALMDTTNTDVDDLAHRLGWSSEQVQAVLGELVAKGLVDDSAKP